MTSYIGLLDGEPGGYGIVFPDLPGCTTMGDTVEEAIGNGDEAMSMWMKAVEEGGGVIPAPRSFEAMRDDEDVQSALREGASVVVVPLLSR